MCIYRLVSVHPRKSLCSEHPRIDRLWWDIATCVSQPSVVVYEQASSEQWLCVCVSVCLKHRVTVVAGQGEGYIIPMRVLGATTLSSLATVVSCHRTHHTTLAALRTSLPNLQQSGVRRWGAWAVGGGGGGGARGVRAQGRVRGVVVAMATGTITPVEVFVKAAAGQPDQLGDCEFVPPSFPVDRNLVDLSVNVASKLRPWLPVQILNWDKGVLVKNATSCVQLIYPVYSVLEFPRHQCSAAVGSFCLHRCMLVRDKNGVCRAGSGHVA